MHKPDEWFRQAEYDLDTADCMFCSGRYFYAVFMCHLTAEKALKGRLASISQEDPPRTHDLLLLLKRTNLDPPELLAKFLITLNEASVATRYPEDLDVLTSHYPKPVTATVLRRTKEFIEWIRQF